MHDVQKQLGLRIPIEQYNQLKEYAKANNISITELITLIFDDFLIKATPGLCSVCRTQNPPDAKYCKNCSVPLVEGIKLAMHEQINELSYNLEQLEKVIKKHDKILEDFRNIIYWVKKKMKEEG